MRGMLARYDFDLLHETKVFLSYKIEMKNTCEASYIGKETHRDRLSDDPKTISMDLHLEV